MRKPLAVFGLAAVTLVTGGLTAQALAHEPSRAPDTTDTRPWQGDPAPSTPPDEISPPVTADGWGAAPVRMVPSAALRTSSRPPSSIGTPVEEPARGATGDRLVRRAVAEAGPAEDVIEASRKEISAASVAPGLQAPVQQQVLALVNQHRRRAGCEPLTLDRRLVAAANRHAADMARRGYFDHESPGGDRAGSRVTDAGYVWSRYGENIAKGQESPYRVMTDWMESPGHRENILDCRLDQMGVGLALDSGDTPYWVQDFATPR
ncbi:CAP domain-containing protein [Actinoplanes sp. NEAU-A12]|uniref:CAP domain-containing protein n=1 Tax=Actinoplanes sandaracinus TaxID=3045177 RepID=A0ABT6WJY2_9ACTN|nr:CAP domain-containing protein [Actinoplanes sandaracinus]MDI6100023.1 CAP domain-containing protein [Actinoplanes sandaracinus]